jgi:hypothetical protein
MPWFRTKVRLRAGKVIDIFRGFSGGALGTNEEEISKAIATTLCAVRNLIPPMPKLPRVILYSAAIKPDSETPSGFGPP